MKQCKICNSEKINNWNFADEKFLRCQDCDAIYVENMPSEEDLKKYYTNEYQITQDDHIETQERRIFRITEQQQLIKQLNVIQSKKGKLLDIGCDKGFFLDEARRYSWDVTGIEPSKRAREYCSNIGIKTFANLADTEEKYDAVVMWHSLEHHADPLKTLKDIREKMEENAVIMIRVPAFDSFWSQKLKRRWIWFQPENHYYHFTLKSMKKLIESSGFEVIELKHNKPNNRYTKIMHRLLRKFFSKYFLKKGTIKQRLSRIYQDITGVEILLTARKKY